MGNISRLWIEALHKCSIHNINLTKAFIYSLCYKLLLAMARFRIMKHDYGRQKNYEIQRKSIFGFWYNPDNVDAYTTGFFDTQKEAEECINQKLTKVKSSVVWGG